MAAQPTLRRWVPWAAWPWIFNAPMFSIANGKMAAEVKKAGGIGMVPAGMDPRPESPHIAALDGYLGTASQLLGHDSSSGKPLPVGVGFTTMRATAEIYKVSAVPVIVKHRPAFVWLFGSGPSAYAELVALFHAVGEPWGMKVLVKTGTVAAAIDVARASADAVVAQGSDAGGHLWARAGSIMTLVPEVAEALKSDEDLKRREIPVIAAGGIVNGKGIAAAIALGASGIAMGTRFITCPESDAATYVRRAILRSRDGGAITTVSQMHDIIPGYPIYPGLYSGRALLHKGIQEIENGVPLDNVTAAFHKAKEEGDESRLVTFAGTGVGLIDNPVPAGEIVTQATTEALEVIRNLKSVL
ncbi:2-nitropropane dioxygenase [Hypoxylon argillaceum]|nr:2-nitropropane dioxygenase [Hypoxylon argillaceum]